jgi:hypothetical protein
MKLIRVSSLFLFAISAGCSSEPSPASGTAGVAELDGMVELPGGAEGIGLDDLRYSATLERIIAPAGWTGNIDLVHPDTLEVTSIGGFTKAAAWDGGDLQGVESADEGAGLLFGNDRTAQTLGVVDPAKGALVATVVLEATEPDYVRYVAATSEVWITQPGKDRIDVLTVPASGDPTPVHAAYIPVPGGPEGLAIEASGKRAYAHMSGGKVAVIDIAARAVTAMWPMECGGVHGIPIIDEARGWLFAGCSSAEVVVLDANNDGAVLGRYPLSSGTTILAYSPSLRHFYLRGDPGVSVAVLGISDAGEPKLLGTVNAEQYGHCATTDDRGHFWICAATGGRLLRFKDLLAPGAP